MSHKTFKNDLTLENGKFVSFLNTTNSKINVATLNASNQFLLNSGTNLQTRINSSNSQSVFIDATNVSTSSTTGGLIVAGGTGIGENLYVGGIINGGITTDSTSSVTGAVTSAGGLGVAKALYVGTTIFENNIRIVSAAGTNLSKSGNTLNVIDNPIFSGITKVANTTESTNSGNGAFYTDGGIGVAKRLNVAGTISGVNTTESTSVSTGSLVISGGVGIAKNLNVGQKIGVAVAPLVALHISDTVTTASLPLSILASAAGGVDPNFYIVSERGNDITGVNGAMIGKLGLSYNLVNDNSFICFHRGSTVTGGFMSFSTSDDTERMRLDASGILSVSTTTDSSSSITGAVTSAGGLGVAKALYVGTTIFENNVRIISAAGSNLSKTNNTLDVVSNPTFSGVATISNTTDSTSVTTGAFIVSGGVGIGKKLFVGDSTIVGAAQKLLLNSSSTDASVFLNTVAASDNGALILGAANALDSSRSAGIIVYGNNRSTVGERGILSLYAGNAASGGRINFFTQGVERMGINYDGSVTISNTAESTSTSSGSLILSGGLGISKDIFSRAVTTSSSLNLQSADAGIRFTPKGGNTAIQLQMGDAGAITGGSWSNLEITTGNGASILYRIEQASLVVLTGTASTNSTSGAVIVTGGAGISGDLYVGSTIFENNVRVVSAAGSNLSKTGNTLDVVSNPTFSGAVTITNTTESVNQVTGSLRLSGGMGIVKNVYIGGTVICQSTNRIASENSMTASNTSLLTDGSLSINDAVSPMIWMRPVGTGAPTLTTRSTGTKLIVWANMSGSTTDFAIGVESGAMWSSTSQTSELFKWYHRTTNTMNLSNTALSILATTDSTSTSTGSLILSGGAGIAKNLFVGGTATVTGMLQTSAPVASFYSSRIETASFFGPSTTPLIASSALNGTIVLHNSDAYALNRGTSIAFGGRSNDFGGGNLHMLFARISGVQQSTSAQYGGDLVFETHQTNTQAFYERMRIKSNGVIGIGTDAPNYLLEVNGSFGSQTANILATTDSSSSVTGAIITAGGLGVAKSLYVGTTIFENNIRIVSAAGSNLSKTNNTLDVVSNPTFSGTLRGTGNIRVSGGLLIDAAFSSLPASVNFGNRISYDHPITNNYIGDGTGYTYNFASRSGSVDTTILSILDSGRVVSIPGTNDSTSQTTGVLRVSGGIGVAKSMWIGGPIVCQSSQRITNENAISSTIASLVSDGTFAINDAVSPMIWMRPVGTALGAPTLTTRSVGTKLIVWPSMSGSTTDFAIGMESGAMWFSVAQTSELFKWYHRTTNTMNLSNTALSILATTESTSTSTGSLILSGGAGITKNLYVGGRILNPAFIARFTSNFTPGSVGSFVDMPFNLLTGELAMEKGGSNFNTTTSVFTAPVAGLYRFDVRLLMNPNASTTDVILRLTDSGANNDIRIFQETLPNTSQRSMNGSLTLNLGVNDTVKAQIYNAGAAATYLSSSLYSAFSGYLVG
jgi:hypothetical protein